jgi:hypothetical protein
MNTHRWIQHFRQNQAHRAEPDWHAPIRLDLHTLARVLPSLEQFQLGDGGGPACLIAHDAESFRGSSEDIRTFEEKEHSRLLSCAVKRFGGQLIRSHWSFTAFCFCRRILGVRFELQVLLLTEIVSAAYYRVLRRHIDDGPVHAMCSLILRDEAGHIAFHRARLAAVPDRSVPRNLIGVLQFWLCGFGAASMLWINHRGALEAIGGSQREYFHEVQFEISRFLRRLAHERTAANRPTVPLRTTTAAAEL